MKIAIRRPYALAILLFLSTAPELTVSTASAADICARVRLNDERTRTRESSGCNQPPFSTHPQTARNRARDAAVAAIDQSCRNNVTARMARAACDAAGGEVNEWPFILTPSRSIPRNANAHISVVGKGVGGAGNMNICVQVTDGPSRVTREAAPGSCSDNTSSAFRKTIATATATARCGVVCIVP